MKLSDLIQQERFATAGQEALLNVLATSSWITSALTAAMADFEMTPAQYNVLRILQGSHPRLLTCSAIGARLLDRTPDVTRLLNRLERRGLVHRARAEHDRRVVEVGITEAGRALIQQMEAPVAATVARLTRHLSEAESAQLSALLERLRADQAE